MHNPVTSDQIDEMIPWTNLAWTQVHQGHLPLWNPYSALGMPLAFNWQSAAFGLPALVGYLFPLSMAYTAGVVVTLVVAGTGASTLWFPSVLRRHGSPRRFTSATLLCATSRTAKPRPARRSATQDHG